MLIHMLNKQHLVFHLRTCEQLLEEGSRIVVEGCTDIQSEWLNETKDTVNIFVYISGHQRLPTYKYNQPNIIILRDEGPTLD